ncbi:MAG: AAA family ATPase [archaeon]
MKTIYLLIGPKGSGKSYIGNLIEKELGISFLNVEPFFMRSEEEANNLDEEFFEQAWKKVEEEIEKYDKVILESIGTFDSFKEFLKELEDSYDVKLIKVKSPLDLCIKRIRDRDKEVHVPMSKETIEKINELAMKEKYSFNLVINNEKASDEEIVKAFRGIIR